jgi:hypothetical protein
MKDFIQTADPVQNTTFEFIISLKFLLLGAPNWSKHIKITGVKSELISQPVVSDPFIRFSVCVDECHAVG